ncbi:MAG: hypothetical protein MZV63_58665 [Marinilabiliales bacterium]|nr:hypothetical protein [Marinilabiliales bacterium]
MTRAENSKAEEELDLGHGSAPPYELWRRPVSDLPWFRPYSTQHKTCHRDRPGFGVEAQ